VEKFREEKYLSYSFGQTAASIYKNL